MSWCIERPINSLQCILFTLRRTRIKSWYRYNKLINRPTLDTISGAYTAIFYSPSAYDTQTGRLWQFCIGVYWNNLHARVALRNVKCHPTFNLVEGVLSCSRNAVPAFQHSEHSVLLLMLRWRRFMHASTCAYRQACQATVNYSRPSATQLGLQTTDSTWCIASSHYCSDSVRIGGGSRQSVQWCMRR